MPTIPRILENCKDYIRDKIDAGSIYDKIHLCLLAIVSRILKPSIIVCVRDEVAKITETMEFDLSYLTLYSMDLGYDFEEDIKNQPLILSLKIKKT